MDLALITVEKIIEMFFIMLAGIAAFRFGIVNRESAKALSGLLLNVVTPAMILMSYQIEYRPELLSGLAAAGALAAASIILSIVMARTVLRRGSHSNAEIEQMSVIYSNCGFIGVPLINGILGREGVFLMTAYITVFNLFIWSHGLAVMKGSGGFKTMCRNFVQPSTIAIAVGILFFMFRVRLPEVVSSPVSMVGDMNTPLAMIVAGCNLAESNLLTSLKRPRVYWVSALKLVAVPVLTLLVLKVSGVGQTVALSVLVAAACPTGATTAMFALQYQKDSFYASELFVITTVLSLFTIPLMVLLANQVLF